MKRQRSRGRKPGGGGSSGGGHHYQQHNNNQPNRTLESNGPDMKVRGPASHIYERYLQLARDATSSGDRVMGENYLQHAEHYFRMLRAMQPLAPPPQDRYANEQDFEGEGDQGAQQEGGDNGQRHEQRNDQPDVEFPGAQPQQQQPQQHQSQGRDHDDPRRRRNRRPRYQGEGEREGGEAGAESAPQESAERQPERQERQRDRQPREAEREGGPEGFSTGPKPAFLRTE